MCKYALFSLSWSQLMVWVCFNAAIVSVVPPCSLVCQSSETGDLAVRSNPVIDGTPCYSGTFDHAVCADRRCRVSYLKCETAC